ncbi:MAG TPA: glycosyltransferase family 2 protein [Pyrinomonadaceae bacterium]|nr:glycosyltransferase family 2 protein [Pyrinomonadaceae bacterium]
MSYSTESITLDVNGRPARSASHEADLQPGEHASVSVVIPCFNEERFIGRVLENLACQYDHERYEIIVVDGMSTDDTRKVIQEFMGRHRSLRVRVVDNPARNIPTALNLGIRHARGEIIVRMDAHSIPSANYVRRCVELLSGNVSVVGMPCHTQPGDDSAVARAISLAVTHPFGVGDAKYRLANSSAQFVDTVPFGAFRKNLWEELGGFNEQLLTNEDYDFNYRVRSSGGLILMDASAHSDYFARSRMRDLAAQYFRYGRWKAQMVKLHPRSIRWRQLVAPAFIASIVLFVALSFWHPLALWALLLILGAYASLAILFALQLSRRSFDFRLVALIPLAFLIIHGAWGSSFLLGLVRSPRSPN